jgi:methionyl aminopeptidase
MIDEGCSSAFLGYRGFPGHACISVNEEVVHGIGGERRLQEGDVVKIDIGVVKGKWIGDNARTVAVGLVSEEALRLIEATSEALRLGVAAARAGRRLGDVSAAIQSLVESRGFSVVREFVGHGVGRNLHEEPQIPNFGKAGTGPRLKAGMTLAIEPMVNVGRAGVRILGDEWTVVTSDGKLSAHFEHTVLVTRDEAEILTWGGAR